MREFIEKLIATIALIKYTVQIVPTVEYKTSMERSRERLREGSRSHICVPQE